MSRIWRQRCRILTLSVFLLPWLTACVHSVENAAPDLPDVPLGIKVCVHVPVPAIPGDMGTALSKSQAVSAIADQRGSALFKSQCGLDFEAWYIDLKTSLAKTK